MPALISLGEIEIDGLLIGFSHGERNLRGALAHEVECGDRKQHAGKPMSPVSRVNTHLGNVAAFLAHARSEHQRNKFAIRAVNDDV